MQLPEDQLNFDTHGGFGQSRRSWIELMALPRVQQFPVQSTSLVDGPNASIPPAPDEVLRKIDGEENGGKRTGECL
jgi:hypothetical protein